MKGLNLEYGHVNMIPKNIKIYCVCIKWQK